MSIHGKLVPVFCFNHNVQQEYDYDYTGEYMCKDYWQIVHGFCC